MCACAALRDPELASEVVAKAEYLDSAERADLLASLNEIADGDLGKQARAIRACGRDGQLQDAIATFEALRKPNALVDKCPLITML
jgi:hypothetical protein